ncbi:pilus assembly protein TadC [Arthrobacter sp. UYP6]|uniref:type II secretion system F family protein n=1 Tax=Arthrobacter sp. UYP6 TaxID=1756378 RepID=UPI00339087D7
MAGALVAVLLAAAFLLLLGPGWNTAPVPVPAGGFGDRRAPGHPTVQRAGIQDPALMLDLTAAMLEAGQPLLQALAVLADVVDAETSACLRRVQAALELGASWSAAWELAAPGHGGLTNPAMHLREALRFAATTGAPSAAVLVAEAAQIRRRRSREAERRAAALGVRLVVPLGLCALPAFVALTVVPLLLSLLPSFP